ncbi:hypothetical protein ACNKHN_08410 [Shigella flexneri]
MRQLWRKKENLMESDERILQHDDFAEIMKNCTGIHGNDKEPNNKNKSVLIYRKQLDTDGVLMVGVSLFFRA